MKKVTTAILFLLYFTVSTGFVVSSHFCMNELASLHLGERENQNCDKCGMETDGLCCRDEVSVVKAHFHHTIAPVLSVDFSIPVVVPEPTENLSPIIEESSFISFLAKEHPPDPDDIYLNNRVFRI